MTRARGLDVLLDREKLAYPGDPDVVIKLEGLTALGSR